MRLLWVILTGLVKTTICFTTPDKVAGVLSSVKLEENSETCAAQLQLYAKNLATSDVTDMWALRMLDASSKIPSGLISINSGNLGNFVECIKTESKNEPMVIKGKYCLVTPTVVRRTAENNANLTYFIDKHKNQLSARNKAKTIAKMFTDAAKVTEILPVLAACFPDGCSDKDIQTVIYDLLDSIDIPLGVGLQCQTEEDTNPPLSNGAILTITFFVVIVSIMIASTAYDIRCHRKGTEPKHIILIAFSCYTNGIKLFKMNRNSTELSSLNGIRFWSMMWVITGHNLSTRLQAPLVNFQDVLDFLDSLKSMFFVSGVLSVDTFFVVTGLLVVYSFMKAKYSGKKFNILLFYIHRYLRLTPAFAAAVLVSANLLNYLGSGPYWPQVKPFLQDTCRDRWWTALLYVQNYFYTPEFCIGQAWYLNIDMQLYVFSPIFLWALWKNAKIGMSLLAAAIVTFMIVPFYVTWHYELAGIPTNLHTILNETMAKYYIKTHTRAAPWFIGAILGYLLADIKLKNKNTEFKINKFVVMTGWIVTCGLIPTCMFSGHSTLRGADYDRWGNAMYNTFIRPLWACAVSWVIFACSTGYGGPINWMLSMPIYQVLNRFTYSVYILHLTMIYMIVYAQKTADYFSLFNVGYDIWGLIMYSFGLAVFWVLAFESPILTIEKVLFSSHYKPEKRHHTHEIGNVVEKKGELP